ncbi:MAG: CBS domain-containing protein [Planctomycetes bacterium]|nr:CBS domain-containing protein [Planctomycetota bacterium]
MNVNELMSREARVVRIGDRLDAVARVLWDHDCGAVPVVDDRGAVVGVVTDRDVCMAAYTQGRALGEIPVDASMARAVRTCRPEDAAAAAMATMQEHQVHRLPVVDGKGALVGMLSTNDLVRAVASRPAAIDTGAVVKTLARIGAPRNATAPAVEAAAKRASAAKTAAVDNVAIVPASTPKPAAPAAAKEKPKGKGRKA